MSILSKLFGRKAETGVDPVLYHGYTIRPAPIAEDGQYRLAAWIEKNVDGEAKSHHLVRADILRDREMAEEAAVAKAKTMIDQQGDDIFG